MKSYEKLNLLAIALVSAFGASTAMAVEDTSTLTVSATLTSACEVSATSAISFGNVVALASTTANTAANSGSTFQVACSVSESPTIYASGTREMINGTDVIPFTLSVVSSGGAELPSTSGTAAALPGSFVQDGDLHNVTLYSTIDAADFKSLPSVAYTTDLTVAVVY